MEGIRYMMWARCVALVCALWVVAAPASAKRESSERAVSSKIDRVMVYYDRALVTRVARIDAIPAGVSDIIIPNLPPLLQDDSVRARIVEGAEVKILDVEVKMVRLEKAPEEKVRDLQERLQELGDERTRNQNRLKVLEREREYLAKARDSFLGVNRPPRPAGTADAQDPVRLRIKDYDAMLSYLKDKYAANADAVLRAEQKGRAIATSIDLVKGELAKLNVGQSAIQSKKLVRVTVDAHRGGSCALEISYINYKIKWRPAYDIRVALDEKKMDFTGYGIVDQSSGEDWIDAKLSYSTAQPSVRGSLPDLLPLYATDAGKVRASSGKQSRGFASQSLMNKAVLSGDLGGAREGRASDEPVSESAADASADRSAGSLVFSVPRRSNVPSDGSPHRTVIGRYSFPVKFEYLSVPRLSPYAYLQAVGTNGMKEPVLRGDLNIFMGNDFVGSAYTDTILPGQDFELSLSVNENVRVTRSLEEKEEKKASFITGAQRTTYAFRIKVENYSGGDIVMNVIDQIPVSETQEIEIDEVRFSPEPTVRSKKGILKWQLPVRSRETSEISFSFSVNVPKGKEAAFFRTGLSPAQYLQNLSRQNVDYYQENMDQPSSPRKKSPAMRQMLK